MARPNRLTEIDKMQIIAALAGGVPTGDLAKLYSVSRKTITNLARRVRDGVGSRNPASNSPGSVEWREKLFTKLPTKAVDAIERSLDDDKEPHKGAATGIALFKGIGVFSADNQTDITILVSNPPPGVDEIAASCRTLETHTSPEVEATTVGLSESPTPSTDPKI